MKESQFQTEFAKRNQVVGVFELKLCKGKSMPFSALAPHQKQALLDVSSEAGLYHKISDSPFFKDPKGRMRFTCPKPFDSFFLMNIDAYLVVFFYIPRKKKAVYYIRIEDFIRMEHEANRKSFTAEMAEDYAEQVVNYMIKY